MSRTLGPLLEVARIQSEINRLFDNLLDLEPDERDGGGWIPNVDIVESAEMLVVKVELPGVDASKLSLSVLSGDITIEGEKAGDLPGGTREYHVAERAFGHFKRVIHLGAPVNTRQASAILKNGLLRICFPKVPNRRGEAVPIEVQSG